MEIGYIFIIIMLNGREEYLGFGKRDGDERMTSVVSTKLACVSRKTKVEEERKGKRGTVICIGSSLKREWDRY